MIGATGWTSGCRSSLETGREDDGTIEGMVTGGWYAGWW
jgi:hypothetical protein